MFFLLVLCCSFCLSHFIMNLFLVMLSSFKKFIFSHSFVSLLFQKGESIPRAWIIMQAVENNDAKQSQCPHLPPHLPLPRSLILTVRPGHSSCPVLSAGLCMLFSYMSTWQSIFKGPGHFSHRLRIHRGNSSSSVQVD